MERVRVGCPVRDGCEGYRCEEWDVRGSVCEECRVCEGYRCKGWCV